MYYKLRSKRAVPAFYTIKLPSGRRYDWPKNCWHEAPTEEVARFIEKQLDIGAGGWERQSLEEKEPDSVKKQKSRKRANKPIYEVELPPEPEDKPEEKEEEPAAEEAPAEEEDDFMG